MTYRSSTYKLICEHVRSADDDPADFGENIYSVLRKVGRARDKKGELWDKWEVVEKFSTADHPEPGEAKELAWRAYKRAKGDWK